MKINVEVEEFPDKVEVEISVDDIVDAIGRLDAESLWEILGDEYSLEQDHETEFDEVYEFLSGSTQEELFDFLRVINERLERKTLIDFIEIETMADEMKMEFIASIFNKYTLEQLEEKLK